MFIRFHFVCCFTFYIDCVLLRFYSSSFRFLFALLFRFVLLCRRKCERGGKCAIHIYIYIVIERLVEDLYDTIFKISTRLFVFVCRFSAVVADDAALPCDERRRKKQKRIMAMWAAISRCVTCQHKCLARSHEKKTITWHTLNRALSFSLTLSVSNASKSAQLQLCYYDDREDLWRMRIFTQ